MDMVVKFETGTTLVKAPIGTWKSFIFFDAPLWALYKANQRPLLHRNATQGLIHLLFVRNDTVYQINRDISATKAWNDSIRSRLFVYTTGKEAIIKRMHAHYPHTINTWATFKDFIHERDYEEIPFASQHELEQTLNELLPPKEVATNVYFLMQDQQSIFDLPPWERIKVFKELFNLLWIDHGKEKLQEKKRDLQAQIKELSTTDRMDEKYKMYTESLNHLHQQVDDRRLWKDDWASAPSRIVRPSQITDAWWQRKMSTLYQDSILLWQNGRLEEKSRHSDDLEQLHNTAQAISLARDQFIKDNARLEEMKKNVESLQERVRINQHQHGEITNKLTVLYQEQKTLQTIDEEIQNVQKNIDKIQDHEEALMADINWSTVESFGGPQQWFLEYYWWIHQQIMNAQEYQGKKQRWLELSQRWDERKKNIVNKIQDLQQNHQELLNEIHKQQQFHCEKIQGNCPYVDIIKGWSVRSLLRQAENILWQIETLKEEWKNEKKTLDEEYQRYTELQVEESITHYTRLFASLPRKDMKQRHETYTWLQNKRRTLTTQRTQWEEKKQTMHEITTSILHLHQQWERLLQDYTTLSDEVNNLTKEYKQGMIAMTQNPWTQYTVSWEAIQKIITTYWYLHELMQEYTFKKYRLKQVIDEERICSALLMIFSKELLLVVLQEFLPTLEDVINNNLANIVDWKLRFELKENDKVELEIWIDDQKGKRHCKSLSGGQKTILKLVRILSVATMLQTKFLYMDETINNIDEDTIARVAMLLEDYIKSRSLSCVVVTHAPQIQNMALWDRTIDLWEMLG
jgi:DNA repair exonuclease SbcCD ATPase subunit